MNSLDANIRNTKTKGELNSLRDNGNVPAIIYGGEAQNEKISISKKILKSLTYFKGFKVPRVNNIKHSLSKGFSSLCTLVMVRKTTYSSLFMITWTHLELYKRIHPRVL